MGTSLQQWPALVITSGPEAGRSFTIGVGRFVLGRGADADIVLDSASVSRHHAALRRDGETVTIEDLGSTNGTSVNGDTLTRPATLGTGDLLRLGDIELQFGVIGMPPQRGGEGPATSYDFGDVHGPVNAGGGAMNVGSGQQYVASGNIHHGDTYDVEIHHDYDSSDEIFQGKGPGRVLAVVGMVVALVGFGIWMALIFSGFGVNDPNDTTPFDRTFAGIPLLAIGFALFLGGGILAGVGSGMSKAARRREAQAEKQAEKQRRQR